ncbi:hypothetical protein CCHL11_09632 [Colletotrichum chlorophyti]|uniref:Peptidase S33 tripeptidyl aminopeptidase-like C-terminal domain-containing protein n=1 Tax=Colletotrichum chlorophyti TaxID=708187 RepID=A0A1Q8S8C1_9PEZI|nr:hypothetical protein CCHL11_09632 [Colletotrichum chlorophyti]
MLFKITIASLALAGKVLWTLAAITRSHSSSPFDWGPCEFVYEIEATAKFECSNFTVPLDCLKTSVNKTLNLRVTRVPAVNGESHGSIFFNQLRRAESRMQLKDALEGPESLLNYWGMSYGTILARHNCGRHVLRQDGSSDVDNAVYDYLDRCVKAGPDLCPLAARNKSAYVLNKRMYEFMDELLRLPIPIGDATVIDASAFKLALRLILYGNSLWPTFSIILNELFKAADQRDLNTIVSIWIPVAEATDIMGHLQDDSMFGIYCSDKNTGTDSFDDIFAVSEELAGVSKALGEVPNNLVYLCARWPYHAKGGYKSDCNGTIKTANPMLFIGTSEVFVGSGVLTHSGAGHGVTGHPSLCTAKAIRAYFHGGELPVKDLNCTADHDAFDTTKTWKDS